MCGIVGYIGEQNAAEIILDGLKNSNTAATILPGLLPARTSNYIALEPRENW